MLRIKLIFKNPKYRTKCSSPAKRDTPLGLVWVWLAFFLHISTNLAIIDNISKFSMPFLCQNIFLFQAFKPCWLYFCISGAISYRKSRSVLNLHLRGTILFCNMINYILLDTVLSIFCSNWKHVSTLALHNSYSWFHHAI